MRIAKGALAVLALLLLMQSCTVTLPIEGRIIDDRTEEPISGARIDAAWQTTITTLAGSLPGQVVRQRRAESDGDGRYSIGPGIAFHIPIFPFSWYVRIGMYLPSIEVSASGYEALTVFNDYWTPLGRSEQGILFLRWSSWNGRDIRLKRKTVPESSPGQ